MRVRAGRRTPLAALVLLILLAAWLRIYHIGASSLRGDEAFAVRYWAQPPADMLQSLVKQEPHPLGTFLLFWGWKSLAGESETAMRLLPALVNLLGVPAMYALCRRLLHHRTVALIAALLWALNPDLIWHSQDVRNYALWAGVSVVSLWLLLRAADQADRVDRRRGIDWALYAISLTAGLYLFFLEAFLVVVHGLYLWRYRRLALCGWLTTMGIVAVLLIPLVWQVFMLGGSGYHGTATRADLGALVNEFPPTLLYGDGLNSEAMLGLRRITTSILLLHLWALRSFFPGRPLGVVLLLIGVPTLLLVLASLRLDVFRPRYLIAITPALLIPLAATIALLLRQLHRHSPVSQRTLALLTLALIVPVALPTADALINTYNPAYAKAPDWRGLGRYLKANATAQDTVIMTSPDPATGTTDPAFGYYYSGPAKIEALPHPQATLQRNTERALAESRAVWLIPVGTQWEATDRALRANGTLLGEQSAGGFKVRQYRSNAVKPEEIEQKVALLAGSGKLTGASVSGLQESDTLLVLLFWEEAPAAPLKVFVHLVGTPKPDGSPLWAQDDHPALPGRDVYRIPLANVPPGRYTLEFGLYDANTGQRVSLVEAGSGRSMGERFTLRDITLTGAK